MPPPCLPLACLPACMFADCVSFGEAWASASPKAVGPPLDLLRRPGPCGEGAPPAHTAGGAARTLYGLAARPSARRFGRRASKCACGNAPRPSRLRGRELLDAAPPEGVPLRGDFCLGSAIWWMRPIGRRRIIGKRPPPPLRQLRVRRNQRLQEVIAGHNSVLQSSNAGNTIRRAHQGGPLLRHRDGVGLEELSLLRTHALVRVHSSQSTA